MADKYMTLKEGRDALVEGAITSTGAPDAGKIPALNAKGKVDLSMIPSEILQNNVKVIMASEALGAGKYVNIFNAAGVPNVRLADATNDRPAHGFVRETFALGAMAEVVFEGANDDLSGLTPGARVYLAAAGAITMTPPAKPTHVISQFLGIAVSATEVDTDISDETVL